MFRKFAIKDDKGNEGEVLINTNKIIMIELIDGVTLIHISDYYNASSERELVLTSAIEYEYLAASLDGVKI